MKWFLLLWACSAGLLAQELMAKDATHLLTPPPPLPEKPSLLGSDPDKGGAPHMDETAKKLSDEQKKREKLSEPFQDEESTEEGLDKVLKNPKFKLNIPF